MGVWVYERMYIHMYVCMYVHVCLFYLYTCICMRMYVLYITYIQYVCMYVKAFLSVRMKHRGSQRTLKYFISYFVINPLTVEKIKVTLKPSSILFVHPPVFMIPPARIHLSMRKKFVKINRGNKTTFFNKCIQKVYTRL